MSTPSSELWAGWAIHQEDCAWLKFHSFECDMNCKNVFEGKIAQLLRSKNSELATRFENMKKEHLVRDDFDDEAHVYNSAINDVLAELRL